MNNVIWVLYYNELDTYDYDWKENRKVLGNEEEVLSVLSKFTSDRNLELKTITKIDLINITITEYKMVLNSKMRLELMEVN